MNGGRMGGRVDGGIPLGGGERDVEQMEEREGGGG